MKKRGFGVGKWNGAGGKVGSDETVEQAAVREIKEEIGVDVAIEDLEKVAEIAYSNPDPNWGMYVHAFVVQKWHGEPSESEEMKPEWFHPSEIPFEKTWADSKHWWLRILSGEKIRGEFIYKTDAENLEQFEVRVY